MIFFPIMISIRVCKAKESEGPKPNRVDRCMPMKKFRFNEAAGKCEDYSIKGCKANRDSYATREECEIHCSNIGGRGTPSRRPLSNLPLKRGKSRDCNLPTQVSFLDTVWKFRNYSAHDIFGKG